MAPKPQPKPVVPGPLAAKINDNRIVTLWRNAYRLRCPVCKEGKIFHGWFHMEEHCPVCGIRLEREQGYFLGSIYFNYGMTCVLVTGMYIFGRFYLGWPDKVLLSLLVPFIAVFPLFFFRYARASWLVFDQFFQPRFPSDKDREE